MSDPISGGIGKASQQMMQELQKQMQEAAQTGGADKANFSDAVANVQKTQGVQETQKVTEAQKTMETQKSTDVIKAAVNKPGAVEGAASKVAVEKSEAGKGFQKLLGSLVEDQNKLDEIIKAATSGKSYNQQELLAIQASVYKFSQELELTSKVVEKATSGVKQTMQTQV